MPATRPALPPLLLPTLGLILATIATAWAWVVGRLVRGRPVLPPERDERPRVVPWGLGSVSAVIALYLWLYLVVPALLLPWLLGAGPAPGAGPARPARSPAMSIHVLLLLAAINAAMLVLVPPLLSVTSRATRADFGVGPGPLARNIARGALWALLAGPFIYAINGLALLLWQETPHPMVEMAKLDASGPVVLLAVVSGVLLAPAAEELIFRAVVQGWLTRVWLDAGARSVQWPAAAGVAEVAPYHPGAEPSAEISHMVDPAMPAPPAPDSTAAWRNVAERAWRAGAIANLSTSLVFAGIHAPQWPAPLAIFPLSLALGALYQRTGSLAACIAMHATFNGLSTLILFACLR